MGLDGAVIIIDLEEQFAIRLTDAEAREARTVGDLVAVVEGHVTAEGAQEGRPDPTETSFHALRRVIAEQTGLDAASLEEGTPSSSVFPRRGRHRIWKRTAQALKAEGYLLGDWTTDMKGCETWGGFGVIVGFVSFLVWGGAGGPGGLFGAIGVGLAVAGIIVFIASEIYYVPFSDDSRTLGGIAGGMLPVWHEAAGEHVATAVIRIVATRLNIPVEDVSLDSRLLEDLMM